MLADEAPDSDRVSELLSTAKAQAFELKSDIQTMDFFAGSDFGWESHASIINVYKDHINAIRHQVPKLDDARSIASPLHYRKQRLTGLDHCCRNWLRMRKP
jgi:hypothetical protein